MSDIGNMSDADGTAHYSALIATISGDLASYPGITAAMMTVSGANRDDMSDKLLTHNQTQAAGQAATTAKNAARKVMDDDKRQIRSLLKANNCAQDKMDALGFPSSGGASGESTSATVPIAMVDWSQRLKHIIDWSDASAPGVRRKPAGVDGLEIWLKIGGTPPGSEKDCQFLTLDTRTPHTVDFDAADAGKMAYYMLRWQFRDGSKSAWGDTVSATITG
jgi:hypothetical protein